MKTEISAIAICGGILLGLIGLGLGVVTSKKLWRMAAIRGFVAGATRKDVVVTQKLEGKSSRSNSSVYWISWTDDDIKRPGKHRLNVMRSQWDALKPGDVVTITFLPGDSTPYLEHGIYADTGNFIFDGVLLAFEFLVLITGGILALVGVHFLRKATGVRSLICAPKSGQ